eukprot:5703516-Ditylum_brightwellii.AAC.1
MTIPEVGTKLPRLHGLQHFFRWEDFHSIREYIAKNQQPQQGLQALCLIDISKSAIANDEKKVGG